jgi:hypothetical protein
MLAMGCAQSSAHHSAARSSIAGGIGGAATRAVAGIVVTGGAAFRRRRCDGGFGVGATYATTGGRSADAYAPRLGFPSGRANPPPPRTDGTTCERVRGDLRAFAAFERCPSLLPWHDAQSVRKLPGSNASAGASVLGTM